MQRIAPHVVGYYKSGNLVAERDNDFLIAHMPKKDFSRRARGAGTVIKLGVASSMTLAGAPALIVGGAIGAAGAAHIFAEHVQEEVSAKWIKEAFTPKALAARAEKKLISFLTPKEEKDRVEQEKIEAGIELAEFYSVTSPRTPHQGVEPYSFGGLPKYRPTLPAIVIHPQAKSHRTSAASGLLGKKKQSQAPDDALASRSTQPKEKRKNRELRD